MLHYTAHALPGTLLFNSWEEARALWDRVLVAVPGLTSLVLLPDHLHLSHPLPQVTALRTGMRAYARWRNHHRRTAGAVWASLDTPRLTGLACPGQPTQAELEPWRLGLSPHPLAWPFSTLRDGLGLCDHGARPPRQDAHRWYESQRAELSRLPPLGAVYTPSEAPRAVALPEIVAVTSAWTRTPLRALHGRGAFRRLVMAAARRWTRLSQGEIGRQLGVDESTVRRCPPGSPAALDRLAPFLGDPRFPPLDTHHLPATAAWAPYRHLE